VAGGFLYGVLFAGVPYQDPTPEMSTSYSRHSRVASVTCLLGVGTFLLGCAAGMIRLASIHGSVPSLQVERISSHEAMPECRRTE
jgi:hypothetical protein